MVKNEKVAEKQRVKCKKCSFQFTRLIPRGRPARKKATAVILYTSGLSNAIAKLFNFSTPTVLAWIKNFAIANYEKPALGVAIVVELDEMWHLKKRK